MPLGSFNKKSQQAIDSRVGASDNAIVGQSGALIFLSGGGKQGQTSVVGMVGAVVGVAVVALAIALISRGKSS